MKVVVIGGTGLVGSRLVEHLRAKGIATVAASSRTGVNLIDGAGLAAALDGMDVLVDVSNAPSTEDRPALEFFAHAGRNLVKAEKAAGIRRHIVLSAVGSARLVENGYYRAKLVQENIARDSGVPSTIVRSTPFFEFLYGIVSPGTQSGPIRVSPSLLQPIAADDVAAELCRLCTDDTKIESVAVAGPEQIRLDELARVLMAATEDTRPVVTDQRAPYMGIQIGERTLMPEGPVRLGTTRLTDWLFVQ